ncbi:MAG: MATE family efflux transporter [Clostridia bacterium]|nr:MATE family efflux transporter [Clostridia bacterium]
MKNNFTEGNILKALLKFMIPVLGALFLQAMYGAADLLIVGKFGSSVDVSAVGTGSQIMMTLTNLIVSFSMGTTIFLGQTIGEGNAKKGGDILGNSILLFLIIGISLTVLIPVASSGLAGIMNAPKEAFSQTVSYIQICGAGSVVTIAYNLIGSIFRGMGDSRTPLITVLIACICNIVGDFILVAGFSLGAAGAAIATVFAQLISVLISFLIIRKKTLPFSFDKSQIKFRKQNVKKIVGLGLPIALQDFLVGISFLIILAIVNRLGLDASAGVGVAEKVVVFLMLIPSAFMQAMAAFVAQNYGAGNRKRADQSLFYAMGLSLICAVVMFYLAFFQGDMLSFIFANEEAVILASADYLKAYAVDCLLTCFYFCFVGYFNGIGTTKFVMIQGIIGAFGIRVPLSILFSHLPDTSLFTIGLATPASTFIQTILCIIWFILVHKQRNEKNKIRCKIE